MPYDMIFSRFVLISVSVLSVKVFYIQMVEILEAPNRHMKLHIFQFLDKQF